MSKEAMKPALEALMHEMKYVLCCINLDKVPFDGDDFHEALRLGAEALANHCEDNLDMVKQKQEGNVCARCGGIVYDPVIKQEQGEPVAYIHRNEYNEYRLEPHDNFDIKSIPFNVDVPLFKEKNT